MSHQGWSGWLSRAIRQKKLRYFFSFVPADARILDFGCADGWVGQWARANGWTNLTGLDAVAPAGSGTVGVSVITRHGTIASAGLARYTYLSVNTVFPASGRAAGGQLATLTGSGFSGVEAVYFGSTAAPTSSP